MRNEIVGFEHLHLHTDFSVLDGYGMVEEYAKRAPEINQQYLCISDHGALGSIPRQIKACEKNGIKPIFACELYLNQMQPEVKPGEVMANYTSTLDPAEKKKLNKSYHLLGIAYNQTGYSNLVKLSSWGWTRGFYRKPRVNYEMLEKHKEGIIFTSCCYMSEVGQAFENHGEDAAFDVIEKYMAMFGDKFYLEFMLLDFVKQKPYDIFIIKAHQKYNIPLIVTNDCHYCKKEDSRMQRLMLMVQTRKTISQIERAIEDDATADFFELQDQNLWQKSEEELNAKWLSDYSDVIDFEIFTQAKLNTIEVCKLASGVELDRSIKLPELEDDNERLKEAVLEGFGIRRLPKTREYLDRIKDELELIFKKNFSSYFLIQKMMTDEGRRVCPEIMGFGDGSEGVGPGRGCLSGNTPVVVGNGSTKNLKNISRGDLVVCRDGVLRPVLKTFEYSVDETLLNIKCYYGETTGITLTLDHKVFCEKGKRPENYENWADSTRKSRKSWLEPKGDLNWIPASEVKVGDWVFVPTPQNSKPIKSIDLAKFENGTSITVDEQYVYHNVINPLTKNTNRIKRSLRNIPLDDDWCYVLGRFAGDGWTRSRRDDPTIAFALHSDDVEGLELLEDIFIKYEFDDQLVSKHKEKALKQFFVKNKCLHSLFENLFEDYEHTAETKHVPKVILEGSKKQALAFLRGYFDSDGHLDAHKTKFTSVSRRLVDEVRFLCWKAGIPASLGVDDRDDPREEFANAQKSYYINIPKTLEIDGKGNEKRYVYRNVEGGILLRVRSIKEITDVNKVYDLQIADESNYLTSSFLVHNSGVGSLVNYCLGVTDVNPIEHELLFWRFLSPARGGRQMKIRFQRKPIDESSEIVGVEQVEECPF